MIGVFLVLDGAGNPCPLQALKALELPGANGLDPMGRYGSICRDGTVQLERMTCFFFGGGGDHVGDFK